MHWLPDWWLIPLENSQAHPPRLINSPPKALQQFVKVGLKNKTADYDIAQLGKQRIAFSPSSKFYPMLYLNQIPRYAYKKSLALEFWLQTLSSARGGGGGTPFLIYH